MIWISVEKVINYMGKRCDYCKQLPHGKRIHMRYDYYHSLVFCGRRCMDGYFHKMVDEAEGRFKCLKQ